VELTAVVLVGKSKRFPNKHLRYIGGKRLIDLVVENLKNIGFDVLVYSKYPFPISAPLILDEHDWLLPSLISLIKKLRRGIFVFGGDMPLVQMEAVERMISHLNHTIVVPRWKNGYLEPLHAYYTPKIIPAFEEEMTSKNPSLHGAIKRCRDVHYIPAEELPSLTFFNVNTPQDFAHLKELLKNTKIF